MSQESYKCMRCGHTYELEVDPKHEHKDRVCPRCKSNSVRKLKAA
jgi:DNA-directed RNA polymerase subunit RPC12/RpoP